MNKLSWKACFKIVISVFLLYLCIDNAGVLGMLGSVPIASAIYNIVKNDVRKAEVEEV